MQVSSRLKQGTIMDVMWGGGGYAAWAASFRLVLLDGASIRSGIVVICGYIKSPYFSSSSSVSHNIMPGYNRCRLPSHSLFASSRDNEC